MKTLVCLLTWILAGCGYVNDSRVYCIRPSVPQDDGQPIAKVVEARLVQKGLVLKTRFHDTYPADVAVSVLEIPRLPNEKRQDPLLIVYVKNGNIVELEHSEWWLNTSKRPTDYIEESAPELIHAIKTELGLEVELAIVKEKLYK